MNAEEKAERDIRFSRMLERLARLTPKGMDRLIGRLIGCATDKQVVTAEIERVLHRLETANHLRVCWTANDEQIDRATPVCEAGTGADQ